MNSRHGVSITDEIISQAKAKLVEIVSQYSNGKTSMHLFNAVVWQCYVCKTINYAQVDHCSSCGCFWLEKRNKETNEPLRNRQ